MNSSMTNAIKRFALLSLTVSGVSVYGGDSIFSDKNKNGDLADAGNWSGGILPGSSTTVVLRPDWSVSQNRTEYILSDDVAYGKFDVSNFKAPAVLDLRRHAFSAASFVLWSNPNPFALTNGTFASAGGFTVDASSTAVIGPGATVTMPASMAAPGVKVNAGGKLVVDGGEFNLPSISDSGYALGNIFGNWNEAGRTLEVKNGGVLKTPNAGRNQLTFLNGSTLKVADGTIDISNGTDTMFPFITGLGNCGVSATNSTFSLSAWSVGGCSQMTVGCWNGKFSFFDTKFSATADKGMYFYHGSDAQSKNNEFTFAGVKGVADFSVEFNGVNNSMTVEDGVKKKYTSLTKGSGNRFRLKNAVHVEGNVSLAGIGNGFMATNSAMTNDVEFTGGTTNCVCMDGGTWKGNVDISNGLTNRVVLANATFVGRIGIGGGTGNGFYATDSNVGGNWDNLFKGNGSVVEISGGTFSKLNGNNRLTFDGCTDMSFRIKDHATAYIGQWGASPILYVKDTVDGLVFTIDDSSLVSEGILDMSSWGARHVVFEFRGAAPSWQVRYWEDYTRARLKLGAKEGLTGDEAPRLRFVLPSTPYAQAPLYTQDCPWFSVMLTSTARIDIDVSQCGESDRRRVYPLIKGASMAHDRPDGSLTPVNAERLAELTANSNLPDGCKFVYDAKTYTLSLVKRGDSGLSVIVR